MLRAPKGINDVEKLILAKYTETPGVKSIASSPEE